MIRLCLEKGLNARVGDLESLQFEESSFDGVWACTSLLHIPKANLSKTLKEIKRILTPGGIFYISMKRGYSEGRIESDKYLGVKRFFALYQDNELREFLSKEFRIFYFSTNSAGNATFLNYLCRPL